MGSYVNLWRTTEILNYFFAHHWDPRNLWRTTGILNKFVAYYWDSLKNCGAPLDIVAFHWDPE